MATRTFIKLPYQLEPFRNQIEPSAMDATLLIPIHSNPSLTKSKLAGYPYLPKTYTHPKDSNGDYMLLLAQINFSEIPSLPFFPKFGLLQFYISKKLCYGNERKIELLFQQDFKVRYFPTVLTDPNLEKDFTYLRFIKGFPIQQEMGLLYKNIVEPVSATDYRRENYFRLPKPFDMDELPLEDIYLKEFLAADHKIGGYPYFIESDTRKGSALLEKFDTLLLQIVSNDEDGIMIGDTGVLKFFINHKKLQNFDFSSIYFVMEQY